VLKDVDVVVVVVLEAVFLAAVIAVTVGVEDAVDVVAVVAPAVEEMLTRMHGTPSPSSAAW